ncbi:hypothetical protein LP419_40500 [Massilia sp. H-1]|nr:hypothetical protein LP419_40500 [Massilia sp. H-1]
MMAQSDTQQDMATVYVAASRSQTKVEQMPLHTTIISQEQIRMASAQTVDQLLRDVPGMNFSAVLRRRCPIRPDTRPRCAAWAMPRS